MSDSASSFMHTHHTHPSNAEPRSKNIPKVNIASGDAGIPNESQKESAVCQKKFRNFIRVAGK